MGNKSPVGDMPRMVPDREDIRSRQVKTPNTQERPSGAHQTEKTKSGNGWALIVLVLVSGIAIGYLTLQQYSMNQLLASYEDRLELADERIVTLEQSLTETDESVAMNGTAINAQFKAIKAETDMQMSEIRKLWDVANKRNRNWIEANKDTLEKQSKNLDSAMANLAKVAETQKADAVVIADLNNLVSGSQKTVNELKNSFVDINESIAGLEQNIAQVMANNYDEQLLTLTLTQENMLAEQNKVGSSADENTLKIANILSQLEAIDASRVETSRRLSALNGQIETLGSRLTELTGSSP